MQRNVIATFDLGDKLSQAKDMQEALKIQSEFFQDQMRTMTDQAKSMGEFAMKAATGVFIPKSWAMLLSHGVRRPPHARAPLLADAAPASNSVPDRAGLMMSVVRRRAEVAGRRSNGAWTGRALQAECE